MSCAQTSRILLAGVGFAAALLGGCASAGSFRFDDIVSVPLSHQDRAAVSARAGDGASRIQREDTLRRELAIGRGADESRERCSVNGGIEGC